MAKTSDTGTMFDQMVGPSGDAPAVIPDEEQSFAPRPVYDIMARPTVDKLTIPNLRIAQALSPEVADEKARAGEFLLDNYEPSEEVYLIPLACTTVRNFKPQGQSQTSCSSSDGVLGYGDPGDALRAEGKGCAECPLSHWGARNPITGKGTPPPCKEGISMLAYSISHGELVAFRFMAQNRKQAEFIQKKSVTEQGYGNFAVRVDVAKERNVAGQTWYAPQVVMAKANSADFDNADRWSRVYMRSIGVDMPDPVPTQPSGAIIPDAIITEEAPF